jgi:hypothetical protein
MEEKESLQIESTLSQVCRRADLVCYCGCECAVISIRTAGNRLPTCLKYFISCNLTPIFNFDLECAVTKTTANHDGLEVSFRLVLNYLDLLDSYKYYSTLHKVTPDASIVCIHALLPECVRNPSYFCGGGGGGGGEHGAKLKWVGTEVMPFTKKLYADGIWEVLAAIQLPEYVASPLPTSYRLK